MPECPYPLRFSGYSRGDTPLLTGAVVSCKMMVNSLKETHVDFNIDPELVAALAILVGVLVQLVVPGADPRKD